MPQLIDTQTLAERLGVPARTIDQWAYQHKGPPFIKVGRHRRYDPVKVDAWLESQTVATHAPA